MPVPQIRHLSHALPLEPMIALAVPPLPVLPQHVRDAEQSQEKRQRLRSQVDGVAGGVIGRVAGEVGPRRDDGAEGADRDDVGA